MTRPQSINHFQLHTLERGWHTETFLPIFEGLKYCEDLPQSFCKRIDKTGYCPFACYCHPMVQDASNPHSWHKLCTIFVAKSGLLDIKELFNTKLGCSHKNDDYLRALALLKGVCFER